MTSVLLALTVLAGCGDDSKDDKPDAEPSQTSSPSASQEPSESAPVATDFGAPAKGARLKGKGYTYRAPKTWQDVTASARQVEKTVNSAAGESAATDGFGDNVNVRFDKVAPGTTLAEIKASVPDQWAAVVKKIDAQPNVVVGDVEMIHHRGRAVDGASKYFLDQFVSIDEAGKITIITFSLSPDLAEGAREKVVNSVMASWKWTP